MEKKETKGVSSAEEGARPVENDEGGKRPTWWKTTEGSRGHEEDSSTLPRSSFSFTRAVISLRVVESWARREREAGGVKRASKMAGDEEEKAGEGGLGMETEGAEKGGTVEAEVAQSWKYMLGYEGEEISQELGGDGWE